MAVMTKVRERSSTFDRFLILLLGVSCVFLVNLVARSSYAPCAESLKLIKGMRGDTASSIHDKDEAAAKEDAQVAKTFFSSKLDDVKSQLKAMKPEVKATQRKEGEVTTPKVVSPVSVQKPSLNKEAKEENVAAITSSTESLWKNKYGVVHVLYTRFMQLQPDLIHLGKARIELFKTFTLRSMREQSTQEYLWIIFTDPELDPVLLNDLVELIKFDKNILLVGMNVVFKDFRNPSWSKNIETVFSGDTQMLKDYEAAAQDHVYVESRIDADDSMFQEFMKGVQRQSAKTLGISAKKAKYDVAELSKKEEFRIFCPEHHLEWGFYNPWQPASTKGHLFGITAPEFCITAGLTYAFQVGTKPGKVKISHHRLDKVYPQCGKASNTNCIDRIDSGKFKYVMLRSRTPTSAGTIGVIPTLAVKQSKEWEEMQDEAWDRYIFKNFGVTPRSIWDVRAYLTNDMENILEDALAGQCTRHDFTCKRSSREDLTNLLEELRGHSGGGAKKSGTEAKEPQIIIPVSGR